MKTQWLWGLIFLLLCAIPLRAQDTSKADAAYQEALRRIEAARVSGEARLDLSYLRLKILPPEIGQLVNLQQLLLDSNQLSSLPLEIGQLASLQILSLGDNQLTSLPPEIGRLSKLTSLYIRFNRLITLPPEIGQLTALELLYLEGNRLTTLPPEIGHLTNLQVLYLAANPITTLPLEIGHLSQLTSFSASNLTFPPPEITSQRIPAMLAYLRDYEAMQMRQTIAAIAAGVGGIAGLILAFRWRQRRGLGEKKKR